MTARVVVIRVVLDGAGGPRDRSVLGWMDAIGGWFCETHPRARSCDCRRLLAEHLAQHPPAPPPPRQAGAGAAPQAGAGGQG